MNWLKDICTKHDITIYRLSQISGVNESTLRNITLYNTPIENVRLDTYWGIITALGIDFDETYQRYKRGG